MTAETVLAFHEDVLSMNPEAALSHIKYLRRTIAKRDTERREVDPAGLTDEARNTLAEVAKSDRKMLATLDSLEATIRAEMNA